MPIYENIIATVGHTTLVKLNRIAEGLPAQIALKGECKKPLGSVKDRIRELWWRVGTKIYWSSCRR